jgi:cytidyltransferase-like protein
MPSLTAAAAEDIKPQAYFYLGKFQPFHNGHLNVLTQMVRQAEKDNARVFLFSTKKHDSVTHPIPPKKKEEMLQEMLKKNFPEIEFKMVDGLFDATEELANQNITHATIMAGDDRVVDYTKKGNKGYNGVYFTVSPIDRTKDNISGTAIRNKILRKQNIDSDVGKVYKLETITELSGIIQEADLQRSQQTRKASASSASGPKKRKASASSASGPKKRKASASKTIKNGGGKRPKAPRRRRTRRRRTRRGVII